MENKNEKMLLIFILIAALLVSCAPETVEVIKEVEVQVTKEVEVPVSRKRSHCGSGQIPHFRDHSLDRRCNGTLPAGS